jgi:hypothetical protein
VPLLAQFQNYQRKKIMKNKLQKLALLAATMGTAAVSHADAIDVATTVTEIGAQAAPIALVGGAVLAIVVAVKAFKWVRSALS